MLTILKAQPSGYNRDLQEDKIHIFAAADTVKASLDMACGVVSHTKFDAARIAAGLEDGFLDATALAEYLVTKGVAFREAHGIVGTLVAYCEKQGKKLAQLSLDEFKRHSPAIESDVYESLSAEKLVDRYVTEGGAGPKQARQQLAYWTDVLAKR
jgi:argininosuccinate lyase